MKVKNTLLSINQLPTLFVVLLCILLQACASSDVSRKASGDVNQGIDNAGNLVNGGGNIADTYQNSSQMSKGVVIGGATGAVAGTFTTGVGTIPGAIEGAIIGGALG